MSSSLHQGSLLSKPRCRPFPDASPLSDCVVCPRCSQGRAVSSGSIPPSLLLCSAAISPGFPPFKPARLCPAALCLHEMPFLWCHSCCSVSLHPLVPPVFCVKGNGLVCSRASLRLRVCSSRLSTGCASPCLLSGSLGLSAWDSLPVQPLLCLLPTPFLFSGVCPLAGWLKSAFIFSSSFKTRRCLTTTAALFTWSDPSAQIGSSCTHTAKIAWSDTPGTTLAVSVLHVVVILGKLIAELLCVLCV